MGNYGLSFYRFVVVGREMYHGTCVDRNFVCPKCLDFHPVKFDLDSVHENRLFTMVYIYVRNYLVASIFV